MEPTPALVAVLVFATTALGSLSPVPLDKFVSRTEAEFTAALLARVTQYAKLVNLFFTYTAI
jgi:hypothetical protein